MRDHVGSVPGDVVRVVRLHVCEGDLVNLAPSFSVLDRHVVEFRGVNLTKIRYLRKCSAFGGEDPFLDVRAFAWSLIFADTTVHSVALDVERANGMVQIVGIHLDFLARLAIVPNVGTESVRIPAFVRELLKL